MAFDTGIWAQNINTAADNSPPTRLYLNTWQQTKKAPVLELKAINLSFQNLTGMARHNGVANRFANDHHLEKKAVVHCTVANNCTELFTPTYNYAKSLALNTVGLYTIYLVHYIGNRPSFFGINFVKKPTSDKPKKVLTQYTFMNKKTNILKLKK